jgi:ribose 5-phosphate isomerase B
MDRLQFGHSEMTLLGIRLTSNAMKIAIASEHRGFKAKHRILSQVRDLNHEAIDFGPVTDEMCDYPDYAAKAARAVSRGEVDRAILIGGTGIGMNIVANKFPGVRAALCHDDLSAQISRSHNDSNVLCLSANMFGDDVTPNMIKVWLETPFEGGRHARRVTKIAEIEQGRTHHEPAK